MIQSIREDDSPLVFNMFFAIFPVPEEKKTGKRKHPFLGDGGIRAPIPCEVGGHSPPKKTREE